MTLSTRCINLCKHIQTLTKVHTTILELHSHSFLLAPFQHNCSLRNTADCDAYSTHLYGAYEAERWDGKYIYYCPRGLVFIATPPLISGMPMNYCIITGPFIMTNNNDDLFEDPAYPASSLEHVPYLTTEQARSLSELIAAAVMSLTSDIPLPPDIDSGSQADILQKMYDLSIDDEQSYPIESERELISHIKAGDKTASQKSLNAILSIIYCRAGNDSQQIKARIRELLALMSRAAIDGGADKNEILDLCCHYEQQVDTFKNIESLNRWIGAVLHKFISFVFDLNNVKHKNVIFKTTAYIKEHLHDKLLLEDAARQVHLSKSYFCHIIKDELGCTFTEYVNRLRIERSKKLLKSTSISIADVAYSVGFDDQSYFNRIFKKHIGIAPGQFRAKRII